MGELSEYWDSTGQYSLLCRSPLNLQGTPAPVSARPLQAGKGAELEERHNAKLVVASWDVTRLTCAAGRQARLCKRPQQQHCAPAADRKGPRV